LSEPWEEDETGRKQQIQTGGFNPFSDRRRHGIVFALASLHTCQADDGKALASVADVAVARPCCFAATVVGSVFFVLALPFAAASHSVRDTAQTLVVDPARATFTRPVGDFSSLD
jgi:hypothetical protein